METRAKRGKMMSLGFRLSASTYGKQKVGKTNRKKPKENMPSNERKNQK